MVSLKYVATVSLLLVAVIFLLCSLLTFDAQDPSPFMVPDAPQSIANLCGTIGATCAAMLFFFFGTATLLLVPLLLFFLYLISFSTMKDEWDRMVALFLLLPLSSALGSLYSILFFPHQFLPGGQCGQMLENGLHYFFDKPISLLFLHMMFVICFVLIFRLSFVNFVHYAHRSVQFLLLQRRWLQYLVHSLYSCLLQLTKRVTSLFIVVKRLFDGSEAIKSHQYEFEAVVQEEFHQLLNDPIWAAFSNSSKKQETQTQLMSPPVKHEIEPPEEIQVSFEEIPREDSSESEVYELPPLDFFRGNNKKSVDAELKKEQEQLATVLEEKLARFGIAGKVVSIKTGPVVTLFEYHPHIDSKISKIIALEDDLALALQATSIRIIAPIPGTSVVGFEVANKTRTMVLLSTILHSQEFQQFSGMLPLVLGVDTVGNAVITDLATMPHALIAGATGSGKSVALNVILISLLYRYKPDELKLILIDPKRLEFAPYVDIPHLLFPIVTNPKDAAPVLLWVVKTMEERYEIMATVGVRSVFDYNKQAATNLELEHMPFIVVMIDELSDLMMVAGKEIEEKIARIAQMARAAGIHLVVATQRPSVDVITGIIKANFPTRISFKVATKIDSRTILDSIGADKLLGKGDMLYLDVGSQLRRIHGPFVSDHEIDQVASHVRAMQKVQYRDLLEELPQEANDLLDTDQQLYQEVIGFIESIDAVSISLLQRRFRIGYNRSARIIDMLEAQGMIMPSHGGKTRKVIR